MHRAFGTLSLILLVGCAQGGGDPQDAGIDARIELPDAGPRDSGNPRDSGPPDTGVDSGPACSEAPCRLLTPQCGCPSGQSCYLTDDTGMRFCAATGTGNEGDSCSDDAACDPGLVCGGQPQGGCWRVCEDDGDCVGPGSYCRSFTNGMLCSRSCVPTTNSGCPSGWACNLREDETDRWYSYCRGVGGVGSWLPCTYISDCLPGHLCAISPSGDAVCYPYCTVGGSECGGGSTCFPNGAMLGGVSYGLCGY